jgi:hypothetical protein
LRIEDIAALKTEALGAEIVRHAGPLHRFKSLVERCPIGRKGSQAQGETIGRMGTTLQFTRMPSLLEDTQGVVLRRAQVRVRLAWQVQAEPLPGQGLAILEASVADGAQRHACGLGQAPCGFLGVEVALLDPQPKVLTFTAQGNVQHFIDLEIFGASLEYGAAQAIARSTRTQ